MTLTIYIQRTILIHTIDSIQFEMERRLNLLRKQLAAKWTEDIDDFIVEYKI